MYLVNTFCISYFDYNELTSCIENSVDPDQLASEEASWSGSLLFTREASWSGSILLIQELNSADTIFLKELII